MLKAFLLVIVGLAGDPEHGALFHKWGAAMAEASAKVGVTPDRLVYLVDEKGEADKLATGLSRRDEIQKTLQAFAKTATADDAIYIVLFGHGSFDGQNARFNLPGPDMGPAEFNAALKGVASKQVVFVNTSSASGPFLEAMSAPGRTIITATRSGAEQFSTLFGGRFVEAFASDEADADKNRRLTMLEAFRYATSEVAKAYEQEGLLSTEHALLDDNGDKEGSADPTPTAADGKIAASLSLGSVADAAPLPADPKLRALYVERRDMERRVESLRLLKDSMPAATYAAELEKLVTDLALTSREIRTLEGASRP